jgi:hypothetical protein
MDAWVAFKVTVVIYVHYRCISTRFCCSCVFISLNNVILIGSKEEEPLAPLPLSRHACTHTVAYIRQPVFRSMTISPPSPSLSPMPKSSSPRRSSINHHGGAPPGFRVPPKPWGPTRSISQMSVRELHEALERNARMLQALYVPCHHFIIRTCLDPQLVSSTTTEVPQPPLL